jgi:gas vesicle protein
MSSGKVVLGVLAGLAAGALTGVLLAPAKGSDIRKKIAKKGKNYEKKLEKKFSKNIDMASKKFDKIKTEVSDFAQKNMHKAEQVKK